MKRNESERPLKPYEITILRLVAQAKKEAKIESRGEVEEEKLCARAVFED